jgi:hypothetical protein
MAFFTSTHVIISNSTSGSFVWAAFATLAAGRAAGVAVEEFALAHAVRIAETAIADTRGKRRFMRVLLTGKYRRRNR